MNKPLYIIFTIGLVLSIALMLAGYIYSLTLSSDLDYNAHNFNPDAESLLNSFTPLRLTPALLLNLGLILMTFTPVAGVIYAFFYYLYQRQFRFMVATTAILIILAAGIIIGFKT